MLKRTLSVLAIVIAALCTLYFFLITWSMQSFSTSNVSMDIIDRPSDDTAFGGIFYEPQIDDTLLSYTQYRHIEDSIRQKKELIKYRNKSFGSGMTFGCVGVSAIEKNRPMTWVEDVENDPELLALKDSMTLLDHIKGLSGDSLQRIGFEKRLDEVQKRHDQRFHELHRQRQQRAEKLYYLVLTGYSIEDHNTQFFMDKNGYNLAYIAWDSIRKRNNDSTRYGHYERKSIPVRYAADEKKVLIPITKQQYCYAHLALQSVSYLVSFLALYFFFGIPLQIVLNLSKGRAFTLKNIHRFKLLAYVLLIFILLGMAVPYIFRFIYRDLIPKEFVQPPFTQGLVELLPYFFAALCLYLVGKAFERGYRLQQDNALTI